MYKQGEYIVYSFYGVCLIDEIIEKTLDNEKKKYYILHSVNNVNSKITTPVDNKKVKMRSIMPAEKAEMIFGTLCDSNVERILDKKLRNQVYTRILKEGDPNQLVEIINALVIEEDEKKVEGKKISATDENYLEKAKLLLYNELSVALNMETEQISDRVTAIFLKDAEKV